VAECMVAAPPRLGRDLDVRPKVLFGHLAIHWTRFQALGACVAKLDFWANILALRPKLRMTPPASLVLMCASPRRTVDPGCNGRPKLHTAGATTRGWTRRSGDWSTSLTRPALYVAVDSLD
jgi:hypothetical protein